MKKILSYLVLSSLLMNNIVYAECLKNVEATFSLTPETEYKQKTVAKHYKVYTVKINNKQNKPIMLSSETEIAFELNDGTIVKSESRRNIYRKTRKRDVGRYYWFALPGAIIAGGITGITFFIGAPIAALVAIGMYAPTDKAVRTNVKISQDLYKNNQLPIRIESNKDYIVRFLIPKHLNIKYIIITNVMLDSSKNYELKIVPEEL